MTKTGKIIVHIALIALAAILTQVFLTLCLLLLRGDWPDWAFLLAIIGGSVLNAAVFVLDAVTRILGKELFYKSCVIAYFLFVLAFVVLYVMLRTGFFEIARDEERLKEYLERAGVWMSIVFIVLQFLQVVILPIPSTVTVVAGAALFGPLKGSLYSLIGIVLGSLCAFLVGRYAGSRVVAWLIGKETLDKWLKKVKGKDKLLLSAMFLLPVFPDDVLCFVAGLSSMSLVFFLVVILISRVLAIFTTSYSVSLIPFDTWWGILIWVILGIAIVVLFIFLYKKSDAIQDWILKKLRRETRVEEKREKEEFTIEVVGPDGAIVRKGVDRGKPKDEKKKE